MTQQWPLLFLPCLTRQSIKDYSPMVIKAGNEFSHDLNYSKKRQGTLLGPAGLASDAQTQAFNY
jgi:hypothetical protein